MRFFVLLSLVALSVSKPSGYAAPGFNPTFFYTGGQRSTLGQSGESGILLNKMTQQHAAANSAYGASTAEAVAKHQAFYNAGLQKHAQEVAELERLQAQQGFGAGAQAYKAYSPISYKTYNLQFKSDNANEQALLAQQEQINQEQIVLAKQQGLAAAQYQYVAQPQYHQTKSYTVSNPSQYYIPYANPVTYHYSRFTPIQYGVGYSGNVAQGYSGNFAQGYTTGAQQVQFSASQENQAQASALEAHRLAVEEHKLAHEKALQQHNEAIVKSGGYQQAHVIRTESGSGYAANTGAQKVVYTAPQQQTIVHQQHSVPVLSYQAPTVQYTSPVVQQQYGYNQASNYEQLTREQAEYLHRDAIAKQNEIIAQHQALIAGQRSGYASAAVGTYERVEDQQQTLEDMARHEHDQAREQAEIASYSRLADEQTIVAKQQGEQAKVEGSVQYKSDNVGYSGVIVGGLKSGYQAAYQPGYATAQSVEYTAPKATVHQTVQYTAPQQQTVHYTAPVVYNQAETIVKKYDGPIVTKEETYALHRDAIEKQNQIIAQQQSLNTQSVHQQQSGYAAPVVVKTSQVYTAPAPTVQIVKNVIPAVQHHTLVKNVEVVPSVYSAPVVHQTGYVKKYDGPIVTREQTYELHRDAIDKQNQIVQHQQAFIAQQNAAIEQHKKFAQSAQYVSPAVDGAYAQGYSRTNYVTVAQPAIQQYIASPGYTLKSHYVDDQAQEQALLLRQQAETQAQTAFAKAQGEAAAQYQGAEHVVKTSVHSSQQTPYFYYRYANPTFTGHYRTQPLVYVDNVSQTKLW